MQENGERWINLTEAAAHLNVSKSFLYQKGQSLGIPRAKLGSNAEPSTVGLVIKENKYGTQVWDKE